MSMTFRWLDSRHESKHNGWQVHIRFEEDRGCINLETFSTFNGVGHPKTKGNIMVGNDVYLCHGATILSGITIGDGAVVAAEKIRKCMENAKFQRNMTLSIGVTHFRGNMTRHELTFNVDRALYQAKNQGKNRVCVF